VPTVVIAVRRLAARPRRAPLDPRLPLVLDLAAAALHAGRTAPQALTLAAPIAGADVEHDLHQAAGLLELGADPVEAWRHVGADTPLATVAQAARRSADSGIRLARGFEQAAADLRMRRRGEAEIRAHRAGVLALLPLGLCFLPAFVCLGIIPVIVGVARGVAGTVLH
jgi:Flp pilus assembly protein TadB